MDGWGLDPAISAGPSSLVRLGRRRARPPGPAVLVHGDLHGDNQVWDHDELRLVTDFENIGTAEPEYELRAFPGPGMGTGLELLTAIMRHYQQVTGRQLSPARIMAWHLRQALGDVLWRSEAASAGGSPDTTTVGRGPSRALQRTQHRPRSATRS